MIVGEKMRKTNKKYEKLQRNFREKERLTDFHHGTNFIYDLYQTCSQTNEKCSISSLIFSVGIIIGLLSRQLNN